ncbi:hypothetical protein RF55_14940 [Lasius niger]|uniref:Uncharacterized protein n=1 Tax=Lasius niger TaxID=67767 RepID=A0A0J7K7D8_LASNI|nr:hypothetical protein RF55_14940 [Lasius niger]
MSNGRPEASANPSDDSSREEPGKVCMMEVQGNKPDKIEPIKEAEEIRKEITDESVVEERTEETASLDVERNKEEEIPLEQGSGQEDLPSSQPAVQP